MNVFEIEDFDEFIFLLSSDWCSPFLSVDLELSDIEIQQVNNVAKKAVKHIMLSVTNEPPDYCLTDLTQERKQKTWELFCDALNSAALERKIALFIKNELSDSHSEDIVLNVFLMLLEDCGDEKKRIIELDFLEKKEADLISLIRNSQTDSLVDHEEIASESNTDWDKYLISLTPEVPTALSDFYDLKVANKNVFKQLWSRIKLIFNDSEKKQLITQLIKGYEELTDNKCLPPNWL